MSPRTGPGRHADGWRRVRTTIACAVVLLTLTSCVAPGYEPEPIDDWESPGSERPEQRGSIGDDTTNDQQDDGDRTDVPADEPIPDEHAALEAVRAWIRAETTAYRGGSRNRLRKMSTAGCTPCRETLDSIAEVYVDDGRLGGRYSQTITFIQGVTGTSPPVVQAIVERSTRVLLDADGNVRKRVPAATEALEFRTVKEGSRWLIDDIISAER